jgi:RimJ/RimL family protein N-acetyltransferase
LIGIRIGEESDRGRGFGRDALRIAVDYCWNHLNLSRLGLTVFANNERAIKLYESLGFDREGLLRDAVFIDGSWLDVVVMGRLHPSRSSQKFQ